MLTLQEGLWELELNLNENGVRVLGKQRLKSDFRG